MWLTQNVPADSVFFQRGGYMSLLTPFLSRRTLASGKSNMMSSQL